MNEAELFDQYLDLLRRDPNAAPPPGLDAETATFIRTLAAAERKPAPAISLKDRVWHKALSQAEPPTDLFTNRPSSTRNAGDQHLRVLKPNEHIHTEDDDMNSTTSILLPTSRVAPGTRSPSIRYIWQYTLTIAAAILIVVLIGGILIEMVNEPIGGYPAAVNLQTEEPKCAADSVTDATAESVRLAEAATALLEAEEPDIDLVLLLSSCALQTAYTPEADEALQQVMGTTGIGRSFQGNGDGGGAFSPDGHSLLMGDGNRLRLRDVATGAEIREFVGHTGYILKIAFSPDGRYILSGSIEDETARMWDVETGEEIHQFIGLTVAFSPDGRYVLSVDGDGIAHLWDAVTGEEIRQFVGHRNVIFGAAFSPDGRYVATSSWDTTVRLWDTATGDELRQFQRFNEFAGMVAFSSDSKYLLNSGTYAVRLSDVESGETIREYTRQGSRVLGFPSFSPDGRYVLASDRDNRLALLWDAETGELVRIFDGRRFDPDAGRMFNVNFSPDGRSIVMGTANASGASLYDRVWLWDTDYRDTMAHACEHITRDFTPEERAQYGLGEGAACLADLPAQAESISQLDRQVYTDSRGNDLAYYLLMPEDYDSSISYPLVVFLHGAGERGDSPAPILPNNGAYEFMETASDYNYFMLIPQSPADTWWDAPLIEQLVVELVSATQEQFSIDPDRIYITGLSAGAFGMWAIVSDNPDIFAAGISVAGGLATPRDLSRIAHIPFQVFHGTKDTTVPVDESRSIVEALREVNAHVEYTEYEGADHLIWVRTYTNSDVIDWLFDQAKS